MTGNELYKLTVNLFEALNVAILEMSSSAVIPRR